MNSRNELSPAWAGKFCAEDQRTARVVNEMVDANLQIAGDVTERRLIDEQLRRVQKMEAVVCKTPTQAAFSFLDDAK